jgi:two-component system sensor histidine kinase YesM
MKWKNSLIHRITIIMAVTLLVFSAVIIYYTVWISRIRSEQFDQTILQALDMNTEELMYDLENTESFLLTKCLNRNLINRLQNPEKEIDRYLAISDIQELLHSSMNSYNMMDGLFFYDMENDIYIGDTKLSGNSDYSELVKESVKDYVLRFLVLAKENQNSWFAEKIGDEYCLVKMYEIQNVYVGSWIHVDTILDKIKPFTVKDQDKVYLLDGNKKVLSDSDPGDVLTNEEMYIMLENQRYRKLISRLDTEKCLLVILHRTDNTLINIEYPILLAAIIILGLCIFVEKMQIHLFKTPISRLTQAMNELKSGNLEVHLSEENVFSEFQILNDTFDNMTKEIKKLKIDVYEEKLNKQQAELLYLQEQINPHFFTNCMNLIRNLTMVGEIEKAQEATFLVSSHMRYALANSTMVALERELEQVNNYVELQKMRYGDCFLYCVEQEEGCGQIFVPTAVILDFVNNAIKHQLDPDRQLEILVYLHKEQEKLHIMITDSGDGFEPEILEKLQKHEKLISPEGEHIGIYNVCQRLSILYSDCADIAFSNKPEGGARIDLYLPIRTMWWSEKDPEVQTDEK